MKRSILLAFSLSASLCYLGANLSCYALPEALKASDSRTLLAQGAPSPGQPSDSGPVSGSSSVYGAPGGAPYSSPGSAVSRPTGAAAPIPGAQGHSLDAPHSPYRRLPLNYQNAAVRLEELRNIMVTAKPKEFQDAIGDYLDWLADMADAHWRIYQAFAKVDSMKAQADVEKQSTLKIGQLKRQAMLLKAEFLIRENRQPEALQPLVDIVVAEPKTATGEAAYALLKQIGFSEEISLNALPASAIPAGPKPPSLMASQAPSQQATKSPVQAPSKPVQLSAKSTVKKL